MSAYTKFFLFIIGLTALIGGLTQIFVLLFAGLAVILAVSFAYSWSERSLDNLTLERRALPSKLNYGEVGNYQVTLENRKLLPVPWLKLEDKISGGLDFVKSSIIRSPIGQKGDIFSDRFGLRWYERVRRRYQIRPRRRGLYTFGPFELRYKGILGFFTKTRKFTETVDMIVYPRVLRFSGDGVEPRYLFGSRARRGWIHTDPTNTMGVRPYQTTDSFTRINWKATARHQKLESDINQPSYNPEVHVFLLVGRSQAWWEERVDNRFEVAVITTASIADHAFRNGYRVSFYTNARGKREGRIAIVRPGSRSRERILGTLALLKPFGVGDLGKFLRDLRWQIRSGSTVIVVSNAREKDIGGLLRDYSRRYRLTAVWTSGNERTSAQNGANYLYVDGDEKWDEIETLTLSK